ncbi:hypothetical protein [Paenibacillus sp. FSL L8-0708]|uniref:hypothetical protein n=1 Tax=Paenibacillus sp. FSL L8-0708 TaxID=2975311 RepID=UPI0030FA7B0C
MTQTPKYQTKTVICFGCGHTYEVPAETEAKAEDYVCRKSCADKTAGGAQS